MEKKIFPFLIILFFGFIIGFPLLQQGIYPTHDGEYHIIRFYEFFKTLQNGIWYPRWAPDLNNGFGLPLFNFVYPLPNYIAAAFHSFGISFIDGFKVSMVLALLSSGMLFYLWMKEFVGKQSSIIASIFYMSSPYHILDIVIRGSIGEVWALAFFPGFLWAITKYKKNDSRLFFILSILFLSLTIFSHNILGLMFFGFGLVYCVWLGCLKDRRLLMNFLMVVILSLGLTAIFWLPAILEKQYVNGLELYDVNSNFVDLSQLLIPSWGSGFFNSDTDPMSVQIGLANIFVAMLSGIFFIRKKIHKKFLFFIGILLISLFLMFPGSGFIWKTVPLINFFQFPWRVLSVVIIIISFLSGLVSEILKPKWLGWGLAIFSLLLALGYRTPAHFFNRGDTYYISRDNFIHGTNSPGNYFNTIWFKNQAPIVAKVGANQYVQITNIEAESQHLSFNAMARKDTSLIINIAYFPGWTTFIDGRKTKISSTNEGLISFIVPQGKHAIEVSLMETTIQFVARVIFLVSIVVILLICFNHSISRSRRVS